MELTLSVRSFQVPATPCTSAWPPSLPSVPTSRATRVTSDGEGAELVDHGVDGAGGAQELAFQRPAFDLERHALGQVALGDGADHARHLARGMHEVVDQRVDGFDRVAPEAGDVAQRGALLELAFLADHAAEARQLLLLARVELDHVVEGVGDLAPQTRPVEGQADRGVAFLDCQQAGEDRDGCRRSGHGRWAGVRGRECSTLRDFIEDPGDPAGGSGPLLFGQADRAVAFLQGLQPVQNDAELVSRQSLNCGQVFPPPRSRMSSESRNAERSGVALVP